MLKPASCRTKQNRVVLALVASAVLIAGCGGSGTNKATGTTAPASPASTTAPATTEPAPTTTAVATIDPGLAAKAQAAVLQTGDFPAGWEAKPDEPNTGLQIEPLWKDLTDCLNVDNAGPAPAKATSPTFSPSVAYSTRSTVEYTTESSAAAIADAFAGPNAQDCETKAYKADADRSHPAGATPGPTTVAPLDLPKLGDKMTSFRANVTMNLSELQIFLFNDFVVIVKPGGAVIRQWFLKAGAAFPPALQQTLLQAVVSRA